MPKYGTSQLGSRRLQNRSSFLSHFDAGVFQSGRYRCEDSGMKPRANEMQLEAETRQEAVEFKRKVRFKTS